MPADLALNGQKSLGRPTKFSDAVLDQLCAALADGMPVKGACVIAGIGVTTLSEWRQVHPEIEDVMSEAREHARQKALCAIKSAGDRDWRAWAEWLRLTFPSDYRGKIEVNATATAVVPNKVYMLSEEARQSLIRRQQEALPA